LRAQGTSGEHVLATHRQWMQTFKHRLTDASGLAVDGQTQWKTQQQDRLCLMKAALFEKAGKVSAMPVP